MGTRRRSRELAMQALFFMDIQKNFSHDMLESFCDNYVTSRENQPFFFELVEGVLLILPEIDALVEKYSSNWKISRMSRVDRNVMRIALYEMLYCDDIPVKVSINEAVDVGKKYGTEESGAFVNGIVDRIRIAIENGEIKKKRGS
jgi:N utilization substance protein B